MWMDEARHLQYPDIDNAPTIDQVWVGKSVRYQVDSYETPFARQVTDHWSVTVVTLTRLPVAEPRQLNARPYPYPIRLSGNAGVAHTRIFAYDILTGKAIAGSVRIDASGVGGTVVTEATGAEFTIRFTRRRTVNPRTHDVEFVVALPAAVVSAAGYPDAVVDWGV
jgi:hypothetical protein